MTPYRLHPIPCEPIIAAVAQLAGLTLAQIRQRGNAPNISRPRQLAAYLCREITGASLPAIGRHLGGQHHTTILHAVRKVTEARRVDRKFNAEVKRLMEQLEAGIDRD